jgi:hypothetical protein
MLTLFDKILKEMITYNMAFQTTSLNDDIFMLKKFQSYLSLLILFFEDPHLKI